MKKKRSLASCIQEFWPATILTPICVIGEVAFDVLIPLMTGKLLDEGVKAAAWTTSSPTGSPWWGWPCWR